LAAESEDKVWSHEASSAMNYMNPADKPNAEAGEDALLSGNSSRTGNNYQSYLAEFHEISESAPAHKKHPVKKITVCSDKTIQFLIQSFSSAGRRLALARRR